MNPKAITDALRSVITAVTGIDCDTGNEAGSYAADDNQTSIDVRIRGVESVGRDERRRSYDPAAVIAGDTYEPNPNDPSARLGGVVETISGNRVIAVQVSVQCTLQTVTAWTYTEKIRLGLRLPGSRTTLKAAGVALNRVGRSMPGPDLTHGNHEVSTAILEFWLNAADAMSADPVTTIEKVDTNTTVTQG